MKDELQLTKIRLRSELWLPVDHGCFGLMDEICLEPKEKFWTMQKLSENART